MHGAEHGRDAAALVEDFQKGFAHMGVAQKGIIDQRELVANELREVGMQLQVALLCVEKNPHQALGPIAEYMLVERMDFAIENFEAIDDLLAHALRLCLQHAAKRRKKTLAWEQRESSFDRAGDQVNVARVSVEIAHELFDPFAGGSVAIAKVVGDGGLNAFPQHIDRSPHVVMNLVADAQEKIVGGFELLTFAGADHFLLLQLAEGTGAVFEKGHPDQVLIIAQAAAAVLDIWFLHESGIAKFRASRRLVLHAGVDVFVFMPGNAFGQNRFLKFVEQSLASGDEPRFNQRRLGLHVAVRHFHTIIKAPDGMSDFQPDVPERVEQAVGHGGQSGMNFSARHQIAVMQKHDVNVAVGIKFTSSIPADGDQREGRDFSRIGLPQVRDRFQNVAQRDVQDGGARLTDFAATAARAMENLQPVRFNFEEIFVARQFLGRLAAFRQSQSAGGICFDFFQQGWHSFGKLAVGISRRKERAEAGEKKSQPCGTSGFNYSIHCNGD